MKPEDLKSLFEVTREIYTNLEKLDELKQINDEEFFEQLNDEYIRKLDEVERLKIKPIKFGGIGERRLNKLALGWEPDSTSEKKIIENKEKEIIKNAEKNIPTKFGATGVRKINLS